ncbi:MAG TPA: hypothetical protein EYG85_10270 [Crocinitomix sp.]|nr:hypothetical protein [Crocinitomix sp.]
MNFEKKLKKYNKTSTGLLVGIILPIVGFCLSYIIKTRGLDISFSSYFQTLLRKSPDKMDIIVFSMIPNMFLFYFVNFRWSMYEFTKGLVAVTLVLCIIAVISGL